MRVVTDVLHVTVHGASHKELCDEVDRHIEHFLRDNGSHWNVVDSTMEVRVDQRTILYTGDAVVRFGPLTFSDLPNRPQDQMRVTLLDDFGETIFTALAAIGESAEFEILPGRSVARLVIRP